MINKRKYGLSIGVFLVIFCLPILVSGETHYVQNGASQNEWAASMNINTPTSYHSANVNAMPGDIIIFLNGGGPFTASYIICPRNNGTQGSPITFKGQDGTKVILASTTISAQLSGKSYISIENFTFRGTGSMWISMRGSGLTPPQETHHVAIKDCIFEPQSTTYWAGIYVSGAASYIEIANNTIRGAVGSEPGHGDLIYAVAGGPDYRIHHILIDGNRLYGGYHVALEFQTGGGTVEYNIIRNNNIANPNHTCLNIYDGCGATLVEKNYIYDGGSICSMDSCQENIYGSTKDKGAVRWVHNGIQMGSSKCIIRNNTIVNNGRGLALESYGETTRSIDNRIYNNTFYGNYRAFDSNCDQQINDNIFKNNIIRDSVYNHFYLSQTGSPNDNYYFNNNMSGTGTFDVSRRYPGCSNISCLESAFSTEWQGNNTMDPQFIDESTRNLRLRDSSAMINTGAFLTRTTSAGSGQSIPVTDAGYLMDGWGLIEGDTIQLEGKSSTAKITNINYNTNTITVDQNMSWNNNHGVSLAYHGSGPDIGAYENMSPPSAPTGLTVMPAP